MTRHQYEIVKWLQRIWRLKWHLGWHGDGIVTKQAEIELAGQAAAKNRPPMDCANLPSDYSRFVRSPGSFFGIIG